MAQTIPLDAPDNLTIKRLGKAIQSGHLNFLIGSGASCPAIPVAGTIEKEIEALRASGHTDAANLKLYNLLVSVQESMNNLLSGSTSADIDAATNNYSHFTRVLYQLLADRRSNLIPKQASVYTTNYDLFVENACSRLPALMLNDGFRRTPSLDNRAEFSSRSYFDTVYNVGGNVYNYRVELPCVNLVKLHGSFSWARDKDDIIFRVGSKSALASSATPKDIQAYIDTYAVILPQLSKHHESVMVQTYYDLLRIFANQLERENALLIVFGFSFSDEHLLGVARRALKNPTLQVLIFAFDEVSAADYAAKFEPNHNVIVIQPPKGEQIDFSAFNDALVRCVPEAANSK